MRALGELQKRWQVDVRFRGQHAAMSLEKDGLVLGAGTLLAKRAVDGALALEGKEERVLTLLSVAYGHPLRRSVLSNIRNASKHARAGNECMAAMHIALALPTLRDRAESARRLFIADGLMHEGVSPRDIWAALEFDPEPPNELDKEYNPDQPRVPAGSGRTSGEWTSGNASSDTEGPIAARIAVQEAADEVGGAATRAWWELLLELGARSAGPLAFLGALLYSTRAGGERRQGKVPGHPDLSWTEDEGLLTVTRESDGQVVLQARRDSNGNFRVLQSRAVERLLNEHSLVDPDKLPATDPRSSHRRDEPDLCPEPPGPDKPQGTDPSRAYVSYMKPQINDPPTPPGLGYQLRNPFQDFDTVFYDDCQRDTGIMIEYKGTGYADKLVGKKAFTQFQRSITNEWLGEATRQIEASGGRRIRWYFAERGALEFARTLFNQHKILKRIELRYAPFPEDRQ